MIITFYLNVTACFRMFREHSKVTFRNVCKMIKQNEMEMELEQWFCVLVLQI